MPETAALAPKTTPLAGHADVLTGEPSVDEINTGGVVSPGRSRISKPFSVGACSVSLQVSASSLKCGRVHFANVIDTLYLRPVPLEHRQTPRVILDLRHRLDAGAAQAQLEAAHAAEQRQRPHASPRLALVAILA